MIPDDVRFVLSLAMTGLDHTNLLPEQYTEARATISRVSSYLAKLPEPPRPNWDDAPPWAMWWTVDAGAVAYWWDEEPQWVLNSITCEWMTGDEDVALLVQKDGVYDIPLGIDWRTLIQRRPDSDPT